MATWIDFKELRKKLRFVDVLHHYHVEFKAKGEKASALCPLPTHPPRGDGKRRTASFSANLAKGIWQCFGCGVGGNVLDFACRMERLDPSDPAQFRRAALMLQDRFGLGGSRPPAPEKEAADRPVAAVPAVPAVADAPEPKGALPVIVNAPLDFELKHLDPEHPYLLNRGFTPETIRHFGLGYCARGLMAGRIAIPLHDPMGGLVGYAGRLVDDDAVGPDCPKYKLPGDRVHDGRRREFRKSLLLYNHHRVPRPVDDLIVVEGFASVWWLWQHDRRNVVALMGSSCSEDQARLIVDLAAPLGHVWIMSDGDEAGERCAANLFSLVAPRRFVFWARLPADRQPTDLAPKELDQMIPAA